MNRFLKYLIIFAIGFALWNYWLKPDKGISDAADYQTTEGIHQFNGYSMTNLQPYTGEFRVLSRACHQLSQMIVEAR